MKKIIIGIVLFLSAGCAKEETIIPSTTPSIINTTLKPRLTNLQYEIFAQMQKVPEPYNSHMNVLTIAGYDTPAILTVDLICRSFDSGYSYKDSQDIILNQYGYVGSRIIIQAAVNNVCFKHKIKVP